MRRKRGEWEKIDGFAKPDGESNGEESRRGGRSNGCDIHKGTIATNSPFV